MFCKRCGVDLPKVGFVCTNCGCMMSPQQIKEQKERMKLNENSFSKGLVTEQYHFKKKLFEKREEHENRKVLLFFLGFLLLILLLGLVVYFC